REYRPRRPLPSGSRLATWQGRLSQLDGHSGRPSPLLSRTYRPRAPYDGISRCHQPRRGFAGFSLTWWTGLDSDGGASSSDGASEAGSGSPLIGCPCRVSPAGVAGGTTAACSAPAASSEPG